MTVIHNQSFKILSLTLAAGLALPASMARAADVPHAPDVRLDSQAQAQRVIVAASAARRGPVADAAWVLDVQLQANRVMVTAAPLAATHRSATAAVHLDAQESARRLLARSRAGV